MPSVDEPDFDFDVVDLDPEDEAFVPLLLPLEVEGVGDELELPMLEVLPKPDDESELPMPEELEFFWLDDVELWPNDEPDVLPDILPEF